MTVQRRLLISNVLMLVIPAVFAVFMALGGLFLVFVSVFPNAEYRLGVQNELLETRSQTVKLVTSWLDEVNPEQKREVEQQISQLLDKNQMTLQVWEGKTALWQREGETIPFQAQLEQSLAALDGQGTVSNGTYDLFGTHITSQGTDYQLRLYNPVVSLSHDTLKSWGIGIGLFLIVLLLFVVVLTNRFLTLFEFRHNTQTLKILGEGVHQIRDGNLTYRIEYTEPDEFRPICEDFNDMAGRLRDSVSRSQKEEESRKELLAGISHDIRSPLTAIQAYVEGLLDGVADTEEKRTAYLSIIQKKSVEMRKHLNPFSTSRDAFHRGHPFFLSFFRRDEVAYIGAFPGKNLIIEILLPVDVGNAVLKLPDGLAEGFLLLKKHFFPLGDGRWPFQT